MCARAGSGSAAGTCALRLRCAALRRAPKALPPEAHLLLVTQRLGVGGRGTELLLRTARPCLLCLDIFPQALQLCQARLRGGVCLLQPLLLTIQLRLDAPQLLAERGDPRSARRLPRRQRRLQCIAPLLHAGMCPGLGQGRSGGSTAGGLQKPPSPPMQTLPPCLFSRSCPHCPHHALLGLVRRRRRGPRRRPC